MYNIRLLDGEGAGSLVRIEFHSYIYSDVDGKKKPSVQNFFKAQDNFFLLIYIYTDWN